MHEVESWRVGEGTLKAARRLSGIEYTAFAAIISRHTVTTFQFFVLFVSLVRTQPMLGVEYPHILIKRSGFIHGLSVFVNALS
jgi:hypothetical protein